MGPHLGPKISSKLIFGGKVRPRGGVSIEFCYSRCIFGFLARILVDFPLKIDEICSDLCCIFSPFSQPGHPHDTSYFTMYNALFDFSVSQDFSKKSSKFVSEIEPWKIIGKRPALGSKFNQKLQRMKPGTAENCQKLPKKTFFDRLIFKANF